MPPLPRLRLGALDELARQLRFAPPEALRRHLERAEALAAEIDENRNYPEDWIVYRITGFRADVPEPATIVGAALLADVPALVERLSDAAGLRHDDPALGPTLDAAAVCARWRISRKTLDRYRRRGLIARRVVGERGRARLVFPLAAVERFEAAHRPRLERAGSFARIGPTLEQRLVRRAAAYRRRLGWSLSRAARRLARRFGRSPEAVRQLLLRHDRAAPRPLFRHAPPLTGRRRVAAYRAWRRGLDPRLIAQRYRRTRGAVARSINLERAARLRALGLPAGAPGPRHEERLARPSPWTHEGLGAPGATDLRELIESARRAESPGAAAERDRTLAYQALRMRAGAAIAALRPDWPSGAALDAIETDLRWAARLKAELVRSQLPLLVRTLDGVLGRPIDQARPAAAKALVRVCLAALGGAVDAHDAPHGGRLAAPAGLALNRAASRWVREHARELGPAGGGGRAVASLPAGVAIEDWTLGVAAWQFERGADGRMLRPWLEPDPRVRGGLHGLGPAERALLERRFGWDGAPPATMAALADGLGTTVMKTAQRLRRAVAAALRQGGPARA